LDAQRDENVRDDQVIGVCMEGGNGVLDGGYNVDLGSQCFAYCPLDYIHMLGVIIDK
tara:strand:- start:1084 stop:1254 length:171 start_codon:yes stop_codon:yes gene_type:complete